MKLVRRKAIIQFKQLEEASTHKSEKIHGVNVFLTRDLDL